ncbi:MAG: FAD:protein FMN transferase [Spirochaetia bacterium]
MKKHVIYFLYIFVLLSIFTSCGPPEATNASAFYLGTPCSLTVYHNNAEAVIESVFARVEEIHNLMSRTIATSDVSRINRAAGEEAVQVSPETMEVISAALRYGAVSQGALDVSIGPLIELWGIGTESARIPSDSEISQLLPLVDYENILINEDENTVFLTQPDMIIDLGGIAKGFAADEAADILRERDVQSAIIDFGGNVYVVGTKPDGSQWRVGIQHPETYRGSFMGIVQETNAAIVTSGPYERYFEAQGEIYHHILDPETGLPSRNGLLSVSIITGSSMDADALSTAAYVMGLENGMEMIEELEGIDAIFIEEDKDVFISSGLEGNFRIADSDYNLVQQE